MSKDLFYFSGGEVGGKCCSAYFARLVLITFKTTLNHMLAKACISSECVARAAVVSALH